VDDGHAPWRAFELAEGEERSGPSVPSRAVDADSAAASWLPASMPISWIVAGAAICVVAVIAIAALALTAPRPSTSLDDLGSLPPDASANAGGAVGPGDSAPQIVVEVSGAVVHPGIYRLPAGARIADAVTAAGGFSSRVDAVRADRSLNLAHPVTDGDEIRVPSRDDPLETADGVGGGSAGGAGTAGGGASGGATHGGTGSTGPIDLNTATAAQLDTLPGIGPVTAAKIIAAREQARFRSVDDLKTRKLLGPATFEKVRPLVMVR
jgi:competence protein ComEA